MITVLIQLAIYAATGYVCLRMVRKSIRVAYLRGNGDGFVQACDDIGECIRRAEQIQHLHESLGDTMTATDYRLMLLDQLEVIYADHLACVKEVSS